MKNGWIKLHRKLLDKVIWKCSNSDYKAILITLLLMANHEEYEWIWEGKKFMCKPGQFITSLKSIKKIAGKGISINSIRKCLIKLEKLGFSTNKGTMTGRLITVVNWEQYQGQDKKGTKRRTKKEQSGNKAGTSNKNVKNVKKYLLLAKRLGEKILKRKPDYKTILKQQKKGWIDWADDIQLMIERDNRKLEQIERIIDWCQQDEFWKNNILSTNKLRIQFDKLELKIKDSEKEEEDYYQEIPDDYFNQLKGG